LGDPYKNSFSRKLLTLKSRNIVSVVLKVMLSYMYWTTRVNIDNDVIFIKPRQKWIRCYV